MWIILPILPSIMKEGSSASDLTLRRLIILTIHKFANTHSSCKCKSHRILNFVLSFFYHRQMHKNVDWPEWKFSHAKKPIGFIAQLTNRPHTSKLLPTYFLEITLNFSNWLTFINLYLNSRSLRTIWVILRGVVSTSKSTMIVERKIQLKCFNIVVTFAEVRLDCLFTIC